MRRPDSGVTLVELAVATAVLSIALAATSAVMVRATSFYSESSRRSTLAEQAVRGVDVVVGTLRKADASTVVISEINGSSAVEFRTVTVDDAGHLAQSDTILYRFEYAGTGYEVEVPIDSDAAASGGYQTQDPASLTKPGKLVEIRGGRRRALCHDVKVGGFRVTRVDRAVTVTLEFERDDGIGNTISERAVRSIALRNSGTLSDEGN